MDFSWLSAAFNWVVQVNSVISSVTSVLGSFTLLGAGAGFILSRRDGGFGPKYNEAARYYRFFKPITGALPEQDKELKPNRTNVATSYANYESTSGLKFRAHFVTSGRFGIYLILTSKEVKVWEGLEIHKPEIRALLGLDDKPGFFNRLFHRSEQVGDLEWEPPKVRCSPLHGTCSGR